MNIAYFEFMSYDSNYSYLLNVDNNFKTTLLETYVVTIHLTKTTAAQNDVALSYGSLRGLYFLAVIFVRSIVTMKYEYI